MQLLHNYLYINALQNLLFYVPKAAVLHGKSVGFASQNSRFRNAKAQLSLFNGIIFTDLNERTLTVLLKEGLAERTYKIACSTYFLVPN